MIRKFNREERATNDPEYNTPKDVIHWFLKRFIHDPNAYTFACRYHKITDPTELSEDQRKRINYNLHRKYTWLNFTIESIGYEEYRVYPQSIDAEWSSGLIYRDEDGRYCFVSSPVKGLFLQGVEKL